MTDASRLLRMLEPMVRPVSTPASSVKSKLPLEQQSFDQMLENVRMDLSNSHDTQPLETVRETAEPPSSEQTLIQQLGSLDHVQNAALRNLLNQASQHGET